MTPSFRRSGAQVNPNSTPESRSATDRERLSILVTPTIRLGADRSIHITTGVPTTNFVPGLSTVVGLEKNPPIGRAVWRDILAAAAAASAPSTSGNSRSGHWRRPRILGTFTFEVVTVAEILPPLTVSHAIQSALAKSFAISISFLTHTAAIDLVGIKGTASIRVWIKTFPLRQGVGVGDGVGVGSSVGVACWCRRWRRCWRISWARRRCIDLFVVTFFNTVAIAVESLRPAQPTRGGGRSCN